METGERVRTGQCGCGATVAQTVEIQTVEGTWIARCAVCGTWVAVA
jgi:hypothetical protein